MQLLARGRMKKKKKPTNAELLAMLIELRNARFKYPNSDFMEYCSCGNTPHSYPQHKEGCLTVKVNDLIDRAQQKPDG